MITKQELLNSFFSATKIETNRFYLHNHKSLKVIFFIINKSISKIAQCQNKPNVKPKLLKLILNQVT